MKRSNTWLPRLFECLGVALIVLAVALWAPDYVYATGVGCPDDLGCITDPNTMSCIDPSQGGNAGLRCNNTNPNCRCTTTSQGCKCVR